MTHTLRRFYHNWLAVVAACSYFLAYGQDAGKYYKFKSEILKELHDSLIHETIAAQELSFSGNYFDALTIWDRTEQPVKISHEEAERIKNFKPLAAGEFVRKRLANERVVIINEAHHQPLHRLFLTSILKDFWNLGFRVLFVEALTNNQFISNQLNSDKFPLLTSGHYIREPFFGDLIRNALELGFRVLPYEANILTDSRPVVREISQAKNIATLLHDEPATKALIYCGHDHIIESEIPGWGKAMAGRLSDLTGINPFTIDQIKLTEHSADEYDNPYWKEVRCTYDAFLINVSTGEVFNGPPDINLYDARLFHPRSIVRHGRPDWVFSDGRTPYELPKVSVSRPFHAIAYLYNEVKKNELAVPFDIIEVGVDNIKPALALKKNQKYLIVFKDASGYSQEITLDF